MSLSLCSCWPSLTANLLANVTASRAFPFYVSDTTSTLSPLIYSVSSHLPIKWLSMLHVSHLKMLLPVAMEMSLLRVGGFGILAMNLENTKREQPTWSSKWRNYRVKSSDKGIYLVVVPIYFGQISHLKPMHALKVLPNYIFKI